MSAPRLASLAASALLALLGTTACGTDPDPAPPDPGAPDTHAPDAAAVDVGESLDAVLVDEGPSAPDVASSDTTSPETRPDSTAAETGDDAAPNACPVARAVCTIDGSGQPPVTDLFSLPLDSITCNGLGSEDVDGEIVEPIWTVAERPDGSTAQFESDRRGTTFFVDLVGRYVFSLEVVDDRGCVSAPSLVTLVARPDEDIYVQLVWSTPSDPDPNDYGFGAGSDIDLHLLHPNGCWEDLRWDCHFRSREPNWGSVVASNDDPSMGIDDTDGWGPEVIHLSNPESGVSYAVGAHYYNDHGYGVSQATVRVYVFGELLYEVRDKEFPHTDFWWEVAAIHWPTSEITPIDLVHDSVPACGG